MNKSLESSAGGVGPTAVQAPPPPSLTQSDEAISAVPAAVPVERGRFVLHLHNRDEDSDSPSSDDDGDDNGNGNEDDDDEDDVSTPDSPKSFASEDIFEDAERGEQIGPSCDKDLERLLGPLPSRRGGGGGENDGNDRRSNIDSLEVESNDSEGSTRRKSARGNNRVGLSCPCCPNAVRRGPCRWLAAAMIGNDPSFPSIRVGNMIVIFPKCFRTMGFGIMGPHWFGPVCCVALLTIATMHFAPKAHRNVGPMSAATCLLFYVIALASLCVVACSDPGVVKRDGGYAGVPTAGTGWRYCDMCSVYQPPGAVHCPECNVCVEGYDHHCPWMGTCIGKKNFTSFMAFNLTWLFYLFYAVIWVTFIGSTFYAPVHSSDVTNSTYSSGDDAD